MTAPPRHALPGLIVTVTVAFAGAGCGLLFEEGTAGPGTVPPRTAPATHPDTAGIPAGYGSFGVEQISVYLSRGELQMRVTPLSEAVIRTTTPGWWQRLSAIASGHQAIFREQTGSAVDFQLFLVAVHSEVIPAGFEPEELALVSRGLRYRPVNIRAVTREWARRVVMPREVLLAVYAFPSDVTLDSTLEIEYQEVRVRSWQETLERVEAEQFRIRSRLPGAR
jgi:hypothetical protein